MCVRVRAEDNDMKWFRDQLASLLFAVSFVIMVVAITLVTATTDITIIIYYYSYLFMFIFITLIFYILYSTLYCSLFVNVRPTI